MLAICYVQWTGNAGVWIYNLGENSWMFLKHFIWQLIFEELVNLSRLLPKLVMSSSYGDLKETKTCRVFPKKLHLIRYITSRIFVFTSFQTCRNICCVDSKGVSKGESFTFVSVLGEVHDLKKLRSDSSFAWESHTYACTKGCKITTCARHLSISIASLFLSAAQIFPNH